MWSGVDRVVVVIVGGFAGFRNLTGTAPTILCASRLVSTAFYTCRPGAPAERRAGRCCSLGFIDSR